MNMVTRVQILDKTVCISHSANTLRKGMNPTTPAPTMSKIVGQTGLFNLAITNDLRKGKL